MLKRALFLLALGLFASLTFAQNTPTEPVTPTVGYIRCPSGQANVFLYESVTVFEVVSSPKCEEQVEVLGHVDTLGGYARVRTADGKQGFVPESQITNEAPKKAPVATPAPVPRAIPAGQGSLLSGRLTRGSSSFTYDIPRVEFFGGYSLLNADWEGLTSRSGMHGWGGSATYNITPLLGVEGSTSGHYQPNCLGASGLTCTVLTFMAGPRLTFHRSNRLTAFAHGLAGLGSLGIPLAGAPLTSRELAWAVGGGADYVVNDYLSVRVGQVDFVQTQYLQALGGTRGNNIRVSAGVVLRLGKIITE